MTDREKLKAVVEDWSYKDKEKCVSDSLVDHLIANGVTVCERETLHQMYLQGKYEGAYEGQKWIPVSERPPRGFILVDPDTNYREPEQYIVFVKGAENPTTAYYMDGKFVTICEAECAYGRLCGLADEVTHWMPLPEPPKGD